MQLKSLVAGVAGALMLSSAAMAADIIYAPPPPAPPPPPPAPAKFDWSGPYAGFTYIVPTGIVGQIGYNFGPNRVVFGIEAEAGVAFVPGPVFLLGAKAKLGVALGAQNRGLLYGDAGIIGIPGTGFVPYFGGGFEIAFQRPISWFFEADVTPAAAGVFLSTGLNFHFGR